MTREEAYTELTTYSIFELFMREVYKKIYTGDVTAMRNQLYGSELLLLESLQNNPFLTEYLTDLFYNSFKMRSSTSTSLPDLQTISSHYQNENYSLSDSKHISIIKHTRYSQGEFHDHDFFEIAYLFTGQCSHQLIIDQKISVISLHAGELVIIPPGLSHKIEIFDDSLMVNILINSDTFQSAFLTQIPNNNTLYRFFSNALFSNENPNYMLFHTQNSTRLEELIVDMYCETTDTDSYSSRLAVHMLNMFFLYLLRGNPNSIEMSEKTKEAERIAATMILYLENNYQKTSLRDLADTFHFSKTYLNRIFKSSTGSTIQQYIKKLRIQEAKNLLQDSGLSVSEICERVGYNDTSYFIEEFKKECGMTPNQYRKSR